MAAVTPPHGSERNPPTSSLQFLRTASDEVLHLLGADLCALPGVRPFGLRGDRIGGGRFGLLLDGVGVFAPEDSTEEGHLRTRVTAIIGYGAVRLATSSVCWASFRDLISSVNKQISCAVSKANWARMWKTDRLIKRRNGDERKQNKIEKNQAGMSCSPQAQAQKKKKKKSKVPWSGPEKESLCSRDGACRAEIK